MGRTCPIFCDDSPTTSTRWLSRSRLIIVSHQAERSSVQGRRPQRTVEAADCLYGVTMQPGGFSRVLSEKVKS
jgi:chromosome segregation ATPase